LHCFFIDTICRLFFLSSALDKENVEVNVPSVDHDKSHKDENDVCDAPPSPTKVQSSESQVAAESDGSSAGEASDQSPVESITKAESECTTETLLKQCIKSSDVISDPASKDSAKDDSFESAMSHFTKEDSYESAMSQPSGTSQSPEPIGADCQKDENGNCQKVNGHEPHQVLEA
jgi:hypothetical protein